MARRNAAHVFEQKGVFQTDVDFEQMGLAAVFQYMIGNTDFAVSALHNIVLIRDSVEVVYPVPYDFDWSGVIWTPYAQPDARLEIRDVRQRVFRGTCRSPQELATLFDRFNAQKDAIYELYRDMAAEGLEEIIVTARKDSQIDDIPLKNFRPIGEFELPEYELQKLSFPPFLQILEYIQREQFTEIIISTPGPMGLVGLLAAKM